MRQHRLVDIEFIRVHRALHDGFAQPIRGGNKHHVAKTRFGVEREQHPRTRLIRAHHALHARRQSDAIVVKTMVHAIGNRAVVVERSEEFFYMHKQRIFAAHMQIAFMLAGKRGVGQVFRRSR